MNDLNKRHNKAKHYRFARTRARVRGVICIKPMIEVTACDSNTGIVLNEKLEWHDTSSSNLDFSKSFANLEDAYQFCVREIGKRNELEFWINDHENEPIRIAIDTIK